MLKKNFVYKTGPWKLSEDYIKFNKDRLILSLVEKLKRDIENNDPSDKKAQSMVNDLLYHYCWKIADNEEN